MCESFSKTSLVAIASMAIDYVGVVTGYSCHAIAYAAASAGTRHLVGQNISKLYRLYTNARRDEPGFKHIRGWYKLSVKEKLAYRTEMLYYFYMAQGAMDGVM